MPAGLTRRQSEARAPAASGAPPLPQALSRAAAATPARPPGRDPATPRPRAGTLRYPRSASAPALLPPLGARIPHVRAWALSLLRLRGGWLGGEALRRREGRPPAGPSGAGTGRARAPAGGTGGPPARSAAAAPRRCAGPSPGLPRVLARYLPDEPSPRRRPRGAGAEPAFGGGCGPRGDFPQRWDAAGS